MEKKVTVAVVNHIPLLSADDADLKMSDYSITRTINGEIVKLQLTRKEQYDAYLCQEHEFSIIDVEAVLEEMESDDGLSGYSACDITGNEEVMAEIVATYTRNKDKYDMEWHQAAYDAIRTEISKAEEAGLLSSGISA